MADNSFNLNGFTIRYGRTTVEELLARGYTVSDFTQITEEPTLATCNLRRGGRIVALLSFYSLTEEIDPARLGPVPIDLVLPEGPKAPRGHSRGSRSASGGSFIKRTLVNLAVHLVAAGVFACIYAVPALLQAVRQSSQHSRYGAGLGVLLLILPAVFSMFIWGGDAVGTRGQVGKKLLLALWLVFNVAVSLCYLVLIDNAFTHRFF